MDKNKVKDITVEILISIRDEIRTLREDTNRRFEQMDKRFEQMEADIREMRHDINIMKQDIRAIVSHFDRDYMLLANKTGSLEARFEAHIQTHR
jgi:TolA-binding protein